jgi:HEAT repeat protein
MLLPAALLLIAGGVLWFNWSSLSAWYLVRGFLNADEATRPVRTTQIVALGETALPALLRGLRSTDERTCANAQIGLEAVSVQWDSSDPRTVDLAKRLDAQVAAVDGQRQAAILAILAELVNRSTADPGSIPLLVTSAHTLSHLPKTVGPETYTRELFLAEALLQRTDQPEIVEACRNAVGSCLASDNVDNQIVAIRLARIPGMDVLDQVVTLLRDPSADVRRAALLAVGPSDVLIGTDDLLQWLHDPDEEVREICEKALRGRGLQDGHLRLGRLMTDKSPSVRLQVLQSLWETDVDPAVWLRRLSHDPAPAVRAGAIRTASEQHNIEFGDRLEQMAQNDPCTTIRQLAHFYLRHPQAKADRAPQKIED